MSCVTKTGPTHFHTAGQTDSAGANRASTSILAVLTVVMLTAAGYLQISVKEILEPAPEQSAELPLIDSGQEAAAPAAMSPAAEKTVEAYTTLLSSEVNRLRHYEDSLRKRAAALDAILQDTLELNADESDNRVIKQPRKRWRLGVGGSEGPVSPILRLPKAAKKNPVVTTPRMTQQELIDDIDEKLIQLSQLPIGTPVQGLVTSDFGWRRSPFGRFSHLHSGIDIAVERNTEVIATGDGVVISAGYQGAYGRAVVIDHGNGIETLYGHMSRISVGVGDQVCRGQQIGLVGSTGSSTGPHVHYEIRREGRPKNPEPFITLASFLKIL